VRLVLGETVEALLEALPAEEALSPEEALPEASAEAPKEEGKKKTKRKFI
jgi:hypothetical protein